MPLKISFNNPNFEKGYEFEVRPFGLVPNGGTVEVTEQQEQQFLADHGDTVKNVLGSNSAFKVEGTSELKPKKGGEN